MPKLWGTGDHPDYLTCLNHLWDTQGKVGERDRALRTDRKRTCPVYVPGELPALNTFEYGWKEKNCPRFHSKMKQDRDWSKQCAKQENIKKIVLLAAVCICAYVNNARVAK